MSQGKLGYQSLILTCLLLLLSACGNLDIKKGESSQIATFPKSAPIAIDPQTDDVILVYESFVELKVANVNRAAEIVSRLTLEYGGFYSGSRTRNTDGEQITILFLTVPATNYESLRRSIVGLGEIVNESISRNLRQSNPPYGFIPYSYITLKLRPKSTFALPVIERTGWNPGRTFGRAFNIFLTIFGFLADIIIWIVVVGGPFFLIFLVLRVIYRRIRS